MIAIIIIIAAVLFVQGRVQGYYLNQSIQNYSLMTGVREIQYYLDKTATAYEFYIVLGENSEKNRFYEFSTVLKQKIAGIFTSPPYVGQIDYHEQHAYAYELFGIKRKDEQEIGPLYKGKGKQAREEYVKGVSEVLINGLKFIKNNGNLFIVANDKFNLYPKIAEISNLKIIEQFKRPVLNRTEKDRSPYCEIIFHMRKK